MEKKQQLQVQAICHGSVIDHLPAGTALDIIHRFKLDQGNARITIGMHLPTKDQGFKDLIKIENVSLNESMANQLALFAPNATVNVINNYQVIDKHKPQLPDVMIDAFACPNSNCITHGEPVKSYFFVQQKADGVKLKCKYCEKSFNKELVSG